MSASKFRMGPTAMVYRGSAVLGLVIFIVSLSGELFAGGFTVGDQGARSAGRSGATVARADDLSAIEYNPAGLAKLGQTRFHLGNRFGYVNEDFKRASLYDWSDAGSSGIPEYVSFDKVSNEKPWQLLNPMIVAASNFGLDDWGFAIGAYAPPGVRQQQFPVDGGSRYMLTERDVQILYYDLSVAWKYNDIFGLGVSLQWVDLAALKLGLVVDGSPIQGMANPVQSDYDMLVKIEGTDHVGFSGIVGAWFRPTSFLELGVSSRVVPVKLKADCDISVTPLVLNVDEPPEMTRNGESANDVTLSMTLPIMARFGVRYIHKKEDKEIFDLEADFVYEAWHQTKNYTINGDGLEISVIGQAVSVDRIVIPKNWKDTYSVRIGGDYNVIPERFTLRAGGFYESAATDPKYAYVDFYSGHRLGASLGASVMFYGFDISLSYTYVFEFPFKISETEGKVYQQAPGSSCGAPYTDTIDCNEHYLGQPSPVVNAGTYVSNYHLASVSVSYGF